LCSLIWFNVQRIRDIHIIAHLENLFLFDDWCSDTLAREWLDWPGQGPSNHATINYALHSSTTVLGIKNLSLSINYHSWVRIKAIIWPLWKVYSYYAEFLVTALQKQILKRQDCHTLSCKWMSPHCFFACEHLCMQNYKWYDICTLIRNQNQGSS
jgi:hypothetical protein